MGGGRANRFTDAERGRIRELHEQGCSREAIAAELGRSAAGIWKVGRRMGLRFERSRAEPEPPSPKVVDEPAAERGPEPIDPAVWTLPEMRGVLARRDIGAVYRRLARAGVKQSEIAALVGQSPSEVSEIVNGRPVTSYNLLVRIADGFGIPRGWMGLAHDETTVALGLASTEDATYVRDQGQGQGQGDEDMRRRQALVTAVAVAFGPAGALGAALPVEAFATAEYEHPLPDWLTKTDVAAVRGLTAKFQAASREYGGLGDVVSPIAIRRDRLLVVPGDEGTVTALHRALADLHTLAGWCAFDELRTDLARWHFGRAIKLATDVDDPWGQVSALQYAAFMCREQGAVDDALKLYQMAQVALWKVSGRDRGRLAVEQGALAVWSAAAFARLGLGDQADRELARAREYADATDQHDVADLLHAKAGIALALGRLDKAERYAEAATDTFPQRSRRAVAGLTTTRAIIYTRAGESGAHQLAEEAVTAVGGLASAWRRAKLAPLESVLMDRADSTGLELARWARTVRTGG